MTRPAVLARQYVIKQCTPPSARWDEIVLDHKGHLADLAKFLDSALVTEFGWIVGGYIVPAFFWLLSCFMWVFSNEYIDELKGIAKISTKYGLTFSKLIAFNYGYDFLAYCTSAVVSKGEDGAKQSWHLRNMDWDGDILRKLTIDVKFERTVNGKDNSVQITTWVGMVGALTGMNTDKSISLNFRKSLEPASTVRTCLNTVARVWSMINGIPVGFTIRYYLFSLSTDDIPIFESPCYITRCYHVSGDIHAMSAGGSVTTVDIPTVSLSDGMFTVITNVDPHIDSVDAEWAAGDPLLLSAVDRRKTIISELNDLEHPITPDKLFRIMQVDPVYNSQTIYTTIMCPSIGYYSTLVYDE